MTVTQLHLPTLGYVLDALAPEISAETMQYHYGKHLQAYIDNFNRLSTGTKFENVPLETVIRSADGNLFNNAAQAWNHIFFFETLSPAPKMTPTGPLADALLNEFGGLAEFKAEFNKAATSLFGSGWVWLVADHDGKLMILSTSNAATPLRDGLTPLLTVDVWEHAYYIDYRNRRADYVQAVWNRMDWRKAEERYI